ncbi:glutathione peroxidase [Diaphorobacter aerolatus]|uniref:Glutathione peroxidase n=1 Tax=Diaphorobacter aerolatus TaxID=1288495 RepID=A0A7H0GFV2_9BURK|nr:glutathione peroxidase [Diaphorobacter aerolatus]QNP47168.1 glutathione peroxidase [Diaphorobacter aerolatus]
MTSLYDFQAARIDGRPLRLSDYRGQVLLIVNTASACGFTPQFAGLEELHRKYAARGLVVLGFPCNQFGKQEPGSNIEIGAFCEKNYGVDFMMMAKIDVNGPDAIALYDWLKREAPGVLGTQRIKWNFTKFLIGRDGRVLKRFAPRTKPEELMGDIEAALGSEGSARQVTRDA